MRSMLVVLAAVAATLVAGAPVNAQTIRKPQTVDRSVLQRAAAGYQATNRQTRIYVVQMVDQPAIAYAGGVAGFAKSAPVKGERYDARSSQAQLYAAHLGAKQDAVLSRIGASSRKVYSYRHAMNGFAARLTPREAAKLRKDKSVLKVWEDRPMKLDTNSTPSFLGLNNENKGLWQKHKLRGKGVIIGMIDTGIVQEHPSLDDTGIRRPPPHWAGICQAGEGFSATDCNKKLIGARFFLEGFLDGQAFGDLAVPGEFESPRDSDGHGTHTATTAAGVRTIASLFGKPLTRVSGMAPEAHLAIYKACWTAIDPDLTGCYFSDTAAATDTAVADGVDVISYSIGTDFDFTDPTDVAFLFATNSGVFVARSAGNDGPDPETSAAGEPWAISVAASTTNGRAFTDATRVNSPASIAGDYSSLEGAITEPLAFTGPVTDDVVAADPLTACTAAGPLDPIGGRIALIERGGCTFDEKLTNAVAAGAGAVLVFTSEISPGVENPKVVMGGDLTFPIPGVMIDRAPGLAIRDALAGGATVNVTMQKGIFLTEQRVGNVMAGFSSRGPFPVVPDWIKPDVTAPGVQILAGMTPEPSSGVTGELFQYLQGTSMSTPHVAGIAALVIQKHPDWTPAQVKSALMTTARQNVVKEDGATPADPFDFGAGHIVPNRAINPGLVYDAGLMDYIAASCGTPFPLGSETFCAGLESSGTSIDPADLNLPSIGAGSVFGSKTVHRTVTNVGPARTYRAHVVAPPGFDVEVSPRQFHIAKGASQAFTVTITNVSAPKGEWRFGRLTFRDDKGRFVRSPIAARSSGLIIAPEGIQGGGSDGATSFDVTFGYSGAYTASPHGLDTPSVGHITLEQDSDSLFDPASSDGTAALGFLAPPAGTPYAQWSLFDNYLDGLHDFDLYLFYCPPDPAAPCPFVDASLSFTSDERIGVPLPPTDDPSSPDDFFILFVHAFATETGGEGSAIDFNWAPSADQGNLEATGPASANSGDTGTVDVTWSGLFEGPGGKHVGAISHNDATGPLEVTSVNIANDGDADYEDLCTALPGLCPP